MTISISPELDRLLNEKLATGQYGSVEEVLKAALRALNEEEQTLAAISEGHDDFLAGRYRSVDEADAEFRQKHGIPIDE
jgi:putative addiction module CopG family antidote